jgi:3-hydroxymyristoyl/3-hydroxydecanoyl-(acyl carrier protein) dehydratase
VLLPRRYRIEKALPRSEAGKLTREAIYALFEPELHTSFVVPEDWRFFGGHFVGDPILPGVVQLSHILLPAIHKRWPELGPLTQIPRIKFRQAIRPGVKLSVSAHCKPEQKVVSFELSSSDGVAAQGVLGFG